MSRHKYAVERNVMTQEIATNFVIYLFISSNRETYFYNNQITNTE